MIPTTALPSACGCPAEIAKRGFEAAVTRVAEAPKAEGFGVPTDIEAPVR